MEHRKQFEDLLKLYKDYIVIFNNWEMSKKEILDNYNFERLINIFHYLTDLLIKNNIIEPYGIKKYRVIESGEIL